MTYPIKTQIAEVRRELGMRARVYPRFVESGRMTQAQSDERIAILRDVQATLKRIETEQQAKTNPSLF